MTTEAKPDEGDNSSDLRETYSKLSRQAAPLAREMQEKGAELLKIQRSIFEETVSGRYCGIDELVMVTAFPAMSSLQDQDELFSQLADAGIELTKVVYDPKALKYYLFAPVKA